MAVTNVAYRYEPENDYAKSFWVRADKSGGAKACWRWTGNIAPSGYGRVRRDGRMVAAPRVAYALINGEAPSDTVVRHRCGDAACVNPAHLFVPELMPESKRCTACGVLKPITAYFIRRKPKPTPLPECKACSRKRGIEARGSQTDEQRLAKRATARPRSVHLPAGTPEYLTRLNADVAVFMVRSARDRAKQKGLEFTITAEDLTIPEVCPVLGAPMFSLYGTGLGRGQNPHAPSLDRIDNTKGYTPDNVVVVSNRVNRIKHNATVDELEAIAAFYRRLVDTRAAK